MSRPARLRLERRAQEEIETAVTWWVEHRPAAPGLLLDELEQAYELLRAQPLAGQSAQSPRLSGVRRVLLGRSRYHLYYRVSDPPETVVVLALWHANRGSDPELQ